MLTTPLQTLLAHKTATLTPDRYGHLFPDGLGRIADAFDTVAQTAADDPGITGRHVRLKTVLSLCDVVPSVRFELTLDGF